MVSLAVAGAAAIECSSKEPREDVGGVGAKR